MSQLDKEYSWFRSTMNTVAQILLGRVSWGLKLRFWGAAFLSLLDLVTDIYVCAMFVREGRIELARLNGAFLATSILLQVMLTVHQNAKVGFSEL